MGTKLKSLPGLSKWDGGDDEKEEADQEGQKSPLVGQKAEKPFLQSLAAANVHTDFHP